MGLLYATARATQNGMFAEEHRIYSRENIKDSILARLVTDHEKLKAEKNEEAKRRGIGLATAR